MYLGKQNYSIVNAGIDLPHNYISTVNPTIDVNPPILNMTWLNSTTGEIFVCTDNTIGLNNWVGSLGREVPARHSLNFDGVDDYAATSNVDVVFPLTVELRFKLLDLSVGHVIFAYKFDYAEDKGFLFKYDSTNFFYIFSGNTTVPTITDLAIGSEEMLLSLTVDAANNATLYKDGVVLGTGLLDDLSLTEDILCIGCENGGGTFANIEIYEFRLWSVELSQQEILNNLNFRLVGDEENLEAYVPVKEPIIGTTLTDYSSNGTDLVVYGTPLWTPI